MTSFARRHSKDVQTNRTLLRGVKREVWETHKNLVGPFLCRVSFLFSRSQQVTRTVSIGPAQNFSIIMKSAILSAAPLLAAVAQAIPIIARQNIDTTVLNFALTLEHLENVFYKQALGKFSEQDFEHAGTHNPDPPLTDLHNADTFPGYSKDYYNNLKYIAHDEEQHVKLLSDALTAAGVTPVQACTYTFPYTDVKSFISLSSVLEGVGTSAYLGAAPLVTSKSYLSVAGSILVAEALHTSLQRLAISEVPNASPYGTVRHLCSPSLASTH